MAQGVTIDFTANLARFTSQIDKATADLSKFQTNAARIGAQFRDIFGAAGIGIGVAGIAAFAKQGIDAADALNDMSQRLGVSVKDLASFKLAAEQSGTSLDSVGAGIARLSRSIGDAESGNKQLAKTLSDLGITARDPKEAFYQLADAVKRIEDPSRRATLLNDVLGKSYGELVPLLNQGSEALRESAIASESFADSMARLAPEADKFNDQLAQLKINAAGISASILSKVVPSFNEWIEVGREVIKTGTILDKIRFFGLGNASDEITNKVRKAAEAAAKARTDAIKASAPPEGNLVNYGADVQAALKKAFATTPLDTFLETFKDRRKKIVDEYKALRADLEGGPAGEATTLDLSVQITKGRAALSQGDASGAQAAAAKAKELFSAVSQQEGTASFEKSYFAGQLESFELSIVDSAEAAATTAQKVFTEKLATLNQDTKNLTVNVDADGLVAQVKAAVEQVKKELAADPLRIPVVAVPSVSSDGRQSVDISKAALQYGNRR